MKLAKKHKLLVIIIASILAISLFVSMVSAHTIYTSTQWGFGIPAYNTYVKFNPPQTFDTFNRTGNFLFFDNYGIKTTSNMTITAWFTNDWLNYTTTAGTQEIDAGTHPSSVYFNGVLQTEGDTWSYSEGVITITPTGTDVAVIFGFYSEITVNDGAFSWTSLSPGDSDIQINGLGGSDGDIDITVTATATFNVQAKGDGDLTFGGNTIPLANVKMHATTLGSAISLSTLYQDVPGLTNQAEGTDLPKSFKLWITVPSPKAPGDYTFTLYIQVVEAS